MTNLAVVAHAADDLRIEDIGEPAPDADEAVVAVAYGGVCGSDLHYWRHGAAGASILREPLVLGHELSGVVVRAAADGTGPAEGTLVAVHPLTPHGDGVTPWPAERPNLAPASTYLGSAMHLPHTQGGFASRVALPTRMLFPLPTGLDLQTAVLAEPAAVAWHAVERAGEVAGRRVAVIGSGPIGLLAVAVARHHGAAEVVATDLHALPRSLAAARGARVLDARDEDAIATLHADVVIESSGTVPGLASAIAAAGRGATVVMLGLQAAGGVTAPLATAITRELTLTGSFRFGDEFSSVLEALAGGLLDVEGIVTHVFPASDALAAFATAADASQSSKVALAFDAA
ncbi:MULTISPECIES: zinc-binding dehydrogenase [Microbacterium]|uniref:zinc-binding dehydrogenase n=1 Tax=Microbacterium TaxID=33882 RepID=UPI0027874F7D|nr:MULTISPECIES: alcohol dehydrogenase catalytic domain-containing protein [Microbacterium]MDQ1084429.1 L-idonate 5-dehydrogenase [Microbacterium sp. SORGH_AS_0344]MDQ1170296.1 L-idonate 5-dehydrogenase [Microbacterium proteolyticum]